MRDQKEVIAWSLGLKGRLRRLCRTKLLESPHELGRRREKAVGTREQREKAVGATGSDRNIFVERYWRANDLETVSCEPLQKTD